jgi:hypothetical protein
MSDKPDDRDGASKRRKKALAPTYQANNKGGYGNPPVNAQFKPGSLGGPGRTAGVSSLETAMKKMVGGKVPLKSGGSTDYMTALAMAARDTSLKKTVATTEFGLRLASKYAKEPDEPIADLSGFTGAEMCFYGAFLNRSLGLAPAPPKPNPLQTKFETGEGVFRAAIAADGHLHFERIATLDDNIVVGPGVHKLGD